MDHVLLILLILGSFTSFTRCQQNYSADSALDCSASDETGPSPAFLYTCNGQNLTCQAFLIYKAQPSYNSVPVISTLTSTSQQELARINKVTRLSDFPLNQEVIVPVSCSCSGQYYQANTSVYVRGDMRTYYTIANQTFEGLSTCVSLKRANRYGEFDLLPDVELQVPLRCACPTTSQVRMGTRFLLTYPLSHGNYVADIALRFNVSEASIVNGNNLNESQTIYPGTTILIPLATEPTSLLNMIWEDPPEVSPLLPGNQRSNRKLYEKLGIAAASSLLVLSISLAILFLFRKERREKDSKNSRRKERILPEDLRVEIASVEQDLKVYGVKEVKKATKNFSPKHRIKGSVYLGDFSGEILAVKKMSKNVRTEVNILKRISHFNLIKLRGVCENMGCFYLIFEHMKNGSLQEWMSGKKSEDIRSWSKKIQIALDVANGLYYLHSFTDPACVHKNITSSHILLDNNLRAKIANFGLARAATTGAANAVLTKHVEGTRGYIAPEYAKAGQVSPKVDVYAFGVVLLELITGRNAVFVKDGKETLLSTAVSSIMEKENAEAELESFINPGFSGIHDKKLALRLARVSLACLTELPASRPGMGEVVSNLMKIRRGMELSESQEADSIVLKWHSSIGETDWRGEAISK